jgi:prepilin-type processing-associated H-X9-DG protein
MHAPRGWAAVSDGLSNTLLLGEDVWVADHEPQYDCPGEGIVPSFSWAHGAPAHGCSGPPNRKFVGGKLIAARDMVCQHHDASFNSRHPGGVQFALADGSVRFIAETIELTLYRALATIRGGEAVTPP